MSLVGTDHWDKLRVIHCGVDLSEFGAAERDGSRAAPEILTVGRVVPVKGQALLIEALADLAARGVQATLTIVGDGPQLEDLRALADRLGVADEVSFEGAVAQDAVRAYYERADVFALPSFAEGLPVVLIEAMATGLPVVASRITGIPELVEDGVSGRLVVPGRRDQLTDSLAAIVGETHDRRRAMGRAGRDRVAAEFDVDGTAAALRALFERMLG
jgi:glycosyltransferase involved in cell wall biosynthesis